MRSRRIFTMSWGRRREGPSSSRSPVATSAGWSSAPSRTSACWTGSYTSVSLTASSAGYLNSRNLMKKKVLRYVNPQYGMPVLIIYRANKGVAYFGVYCSIFVLFNESVVNFWRTFMGYRCFTGIHCFCKLEHDWIDESKSKGHWSKLIFFVLVGNGTFSSGLPEEIFWHSW